MWTPARILRLVTCVLEGILAIPVLGGTIVIGLIYIPLFIMLVLHILTLVFSSKVNEVKAGSIIGIITSVLAAIPFVGWALHVVSFIVLLIGVIKPGSTNSSNNNVIAG